mmetsp:Transcript_15727/g.47223  ORF Transcript_15727/g.47223 Transcript_15727/m.47223 type:complete len:589 (-) Transcript_15727:164-1930(-)
MSRYIAAALSSLALASGACVDSTSYFKGRPERGCAWVGQKYEKRCDDAASVACPEACGTCVCDDSASWREQGSSEKDCEWVSQDKAERCDLPGANGVLASAACPIACASYDDLLDCVDGYKASVDAATLVGFQCNFAGRLDFPESADCETDCPGCRVAGDGERDFSNSDECVCIVAEAEDERFVLSDYDDCARISGDGNFVLGKDGADTLTLVGKEGTIKGGAGQDACYAEDGTKFLFCDYLRAPAPAPTTSPPTPACGTACPPTHEPTDADGPTTAMPTPNCDATGACCDSTSWSLNPNAVSRDCAWVSDNTDVRCDKGDAASECPASCGTCSQATEFPTLESTEEPTEELPEPTEEPTEEPLEPTEEPTTSQPAPTTGAPTVCVPTSPSDHSCFAVTRDCADCADCTPVSNDGVEGSYNFVNFAGCVCLIAEVDDEETPPIALVNAVGGDDCAFITGSDNLINGWEGDDIIIVEGHGNEVRGGPSSNTLLAYGNSNRLQGGPTDDHIRAEGSFNLLNGGNGDDDISAVGINNNLNGGPGDDDLYTDGSNNRLSGAGGTDTCTTSLASFQGTGFCTSTCNVATGPGC